MFPPMVYLIFTAGLNNIKCAIFHHSIYEHQIKFNEQFTLVLCLRYNAFATKGYPDNYRKLF